jgi:hypothetical protein
MVITAVVAVATYCGSVAAATLRGASLVAAAVLPVTRGALDERRLMGTNASDLSALADARGGGRSAPPCERKNREIKLLPLENGASGEEMAYLKVEKPRFLFLKGLTGAVAATDVATVALPDAFAARAGTSVTHAGASAARAASFVDRPTVGASAPALGARSSDASASLGEGGAGSHLSGGPAPVAFFLLFLSRRRVLRHHRGRKSLLLTQPEFLVPLFSAFPPPDPPLLLTRRQLLLSPLRCARALGLGAWADQTA